MLYRLVSLWMNSKCDYSAIQMKATEQQFPVVLFTTIYKVVLLSLWMTSLRVNIYMKATEQYFSVKLLKSIS